MKINRTYRGFEIGNFEDLNGNKCSIQDSSMAMEAAIWLGVDDASPRCSKELSEASQQEWIEWHREYKNLESAIHRVLTHTRVHLIQTMVNDLAHAFREFLKSGNVERITTEDRYGLEFSVESHEGVLLVGPDDPQPQILIPGEGWQSYNYPEGTIWTTKMKLDKLIAQDILGVLVRFFATGTVGE